MIVVIIEDDATQRQVLSEKVQHWFAQKGCAISLFTYADETDFRAQQLQPDLALLDIELGEENGLQIARWLRQNHPSCQIAFVTSYTEYIGECYDVEHLWFIPKIKIDLYLPRALEKALQQYLAAQSYILRIGRSDNPVMIRQADVFYLERQLHTTLVFGAQGVLCTTPEKLSQLELQLNCNCFACPHNSYRVHLEHVTQVNKNTVLLENGNVLPISRACKKNFLNALGQYAIQREQYF